MKEENNEEITAYIEFYNEIKKVILPPTFKGLQEKLIAMLQLQSDLISSLIISYKDEDDDKVIVEANDDYLILLDQIQNKTVNIIKVETNEKANINKETCTQSLIKFKEKMDKDNDANNNLNIVSNQQFEINKEIKPENKNEDREEHINNNIISKNNNININNDIDDELEINNNKVVLNNIDNDLNNSNSEEDIISPYLKQEKNINENNNNSNNINIININNDRNNIENINNINNENINNNMNANVNLSQTHLVFNIPCGLCSQFPIIKILYYCPTCSVYICPECERKPDINHRHSILKVQTQQQYNDLIEKIGKKAELKLENNINESNLAKITNNIKDSFLKIIGSNKEEINLQPQNMTQQMSLIQIARMKYDLQGRSDKQIEEAIRKTNGDIEKAIPLLFG